VAELPHGAQVGRIDDTRLWAPKRETSDVGAARLINRSGSLRQRQRVNRRPRLRGLFYRHCPPAVKNGKWHYRLGIQSTVNLQLLCIRRPAVSDSIPSLELRGYEALQKIARYEWIRQNQNRDYGTW